MSAAPNLSNEKIEKLRLLAKAKGLLTEYASTMGGSVVASPEALRAILKSLGTEVKEDLSNVDVLLRKAAAESFLQLSEPCTVAWDGKGAKFPVRMPADAKPGKAVLDIKLEGERPFRVSVDLARLPVKRRVKLDDKQYVERIVEFKHQLPLGYHDAKISAGGKSQKVLIISAPNKAYRDPAVTPDRKLLGAFSPLYSLHSMRSWGIGDFRDLGRFVNWATDAGCDFVGTLPLYAGFTDKPIEEPSPYSPVSRLFWNEIFVDPRLAAEWPECEKAHAIVESSAFQRELKRVQASKLVDYRGVARLKRRVLEPLVEAFYDAGGDRTKEFKAFLSAKPLTENYAEFRAVCEATNKEWQKWPERLRNGTIRRGDYNDKDRRFHVYVQWLAHNQLTDLAKQSQNRGLGIYLDFPLSVHASGFDTWKERQSFGTGAAAGAPPDVSHTTGQDWGILPLHPQNIRKTGYRYFRACLENQMGYCGMLRLDHVMSLYRLYWVPAGLGAKAGVYVLYNCDELFAILTLESHRNKCMLIGEDLGTVPPEIRTQMTEHEILRMYVGQRSLKVDVKEPINPEPPNCIAGLNTHDMPPFAAFWRYLDLHDKVDLGHLDRKALPEKIKGRQKLQKLLISYLKKKKLLGLVPGERSGVKGLGATDRDIRKILTGFLFKIAGGPARAMIVSVEDLWLEVNSQNVPATWKERPNWRRKLRYSLEQIEAGQSWFDVLRRLAQTRLK